MDTYKISFRKLTSNSLAINSLIVLAGTMGANVLSYVYHLVMGRLLGPAGYGELSSLLSLLYIFTVPLLVAQTVLVKFFSGFKAHGEMGQAKSLFVRSTKFFTGMSIIGFPLILIVSPWLASFLHLSSVTLPVLVYLLLVFSLLTVAPSSLLTGNQKFVWISVMGTMTILIKLLLSIPLVAWGVIGAFIAAVIGSIIVYAVYFFPLRFLLAVKQKSTQLTIRDTFRYAMPTFMTLLGITSLYSTDIILVRHFFNAGDAGVYAALAILGKIIFYASSAVPAVLFPVASERAAKGGSAHRLVLFSVTTVGAISLVLTLIYSLFPKLIITLLFGDAYVGAEKLLGQFALFLSFFSIGNIMATANLAIGKTRMWIIPFALAVIQIIGIILFHATIGQVVAINILLSAIFAIGVTLYYFYEKI